tara:strand:- start:359 stop:649 length:291 start_codon:yes stop_codon:yes gene_type:complete
MTTNLTNDEMKSEILESIGQLTNSLKSKVTVLDALDRDNESGRFDLHDQLTTFHELAESLAQVVKRSLAIVPREELRFSQLRKMQKQAHYNKRTQS